MPAQPLAAAAVAPTTPGSSAAAAAAAAATGAVRSPASLQSPASVSALSPAPAAGTPLLVLSPSHPLATAAAASAAFAPAPAPLPAPAVPVSAGLVALVDSNDLTAIAVMQSKAADDLAFANGALTRFNDDSERAYDALSGALKQHQTLVKRIQSDLMSVFRHIRVLKETVRAHTGLIGPDSDDDDDEFHSEHDDDDDDADGGAKRKADDDDDENDSDGDGEAAAAAAAASTARPAPVAHTPNGSVRRGGGVVSGRGSTRASATNSRTGSRAEPLDAARAFVAAPMTFAAPDDGDGDGDGDLAPLNAAATPHHGSRNGSGAAAAAGYHTPHRPRISPPPSGSALLSPAVMSPGGGFGHHGVPPTPSELRTVPLTNTAGTASAPQGGALFR